MNTMLRVFATLLIPFLLKGATFQNIRKYQLGEDDGATTYTFYPDGQFKEYMSLSVVVIRSTGTYSTKSNWIYLQRDSITWVDLIPCATNTVFDPLLNNSDTILTWTDRHHTIYKYYLTEEK